MKFFIFSPDGDAAGLAHRIQEEGNDVCLYICEAKARGTLQGIVDQVPSVAAGLAKNPDVILFDMVGYGDVAIRAKKLGYNVIGSGSVFKGKPLQDCMELDRKFGESVMRTGNILAPETIEFKGSEIEKAITYVRKKQAPFVIKPNDNLTPCTTHVGMDSEDTIDRLERMKESKLLKASDNFILQEKMDGIEISTEMWFSKGKPVFPANGTMETKKFLVGDMGPNTGCQTSLVWFYDRKEPRMVQTTLKKLYTFMEMTEYTGPLDLNCIVSRKDHKPYGLEWTARPGYSALYAMIRLLDLQKMDLSEHLYKLAKGDLKEWAWKPGFAYAVRVSIPPYPLAVDDPKHRAAMFQSTAGTRIRYTGEPEAFFPLDVRKGEKGLETAGVDGVVGEIVGTGPTIEEAKNDAHQQMKKLKVAQKQARLDGWKRPMREIPMLASWGYEMPEVLAAPKGEDHG